HMPLPWHDIHAKVIGVLVVAVFKATGRESVGVIQSPLNTQAWVGISQALVLIEVRGVKPRVKPHGFGLHGAGKSLLEFAVGLSCCG
ncbi:MAG: hypothetical protein RL763_267, partial [Pseudomonadota bacterium]